MDRLSKRHEAYRVELPANVRLPELAWSLGRRRRLLRSIPVPGFAGVIGFFSGGALVVATASLLALYIH